MIDPPKRFTPEQVLAVFADPTAKPMSTVQIAKACREANGGHGWRTDVSGNTDVLKALKALKTLVDDGRLVTSRASTWGKTWDPVDEQFKHLLDPHDAVSRFYATPEQSKAWQEKIDANARRVAAADVLVERLDGTGEVERADVHRRRDYSDPVIGLTLTIEQAALIVDLLEVVGEVDDDE